LNQVAFEGSEGMATLWPWKQGRTVLIVQFLVFIVINIAKNNKEENVEVSSSDYP
jgi:hypothetical protein